MIPIRDDTPRFSTPVVTYFIIALNGVVWIYEWLLQLQSPGALEVLIRQFGVVPRHEMAILSGGTNLSPAVALLPMITSMFLHASWTHVGGNMLVLWIFGDNIEDYLGHFKYLVFYVLAGMAAILLQIAFNVDSLVPTVGASGAIAGVMGAYFLLYPRARVLIVLFPFVFISFWLPAWIVLGYWFVSNFLSGAATSIAYTSQTGGGIAFWAHVGGFAAGILMIKLLPARTRRFSYR